VKSEDQRFHARILQGVFATDLGELKDAFAHDEAGVQKANSDCAVAQGAATGAP
jgi:hypothetical protein